MIINYIMKINDKYKNADSNKEAIKLLPEIITFLGSVSAAEGRALNDRDAATELTKLADLAEEIKKKLATDIKLIIIHKLRF